MRALEYAHLKYVVHTCMRIRKISVLLFFCVSHRRARTATGFAWTLVVYNGKLYDHFVRERYIQNARFAHMSQPHKPSKLTQVWTMTFLKWISILQIGIQCLTITSGYQHTHCVHWIAKTRDFVPKSYLGRLDDALSQHHTYVLYGLLVWCVAESGFQTRVLRGIPTHHYQKLQRPPANEETPNACSKRIGLLIVG